MNDFARRYKIKILFNKNVRNIAKKNDKYTVRINDVEEYSCKKLIIATGMSKMNIPTVDLNVKDKIYHYGEYPSNYFINKENLKEFTNKSVLFTDICPSFEYIEEFVDNKLHQESNKVIAKQLQKEWQRVFHKKITQQVAESFIDQRCQIKPRVTRQTKRKKGGHLPMNGAPLDSSLRPGIYLENSVPVSTSDGQP
jgi:hypothetical protein